MNWTTFKTYNLGYPKAFESLCDQIFEIWIKEVYRDRIIYFTTVRGDGGDGGVESFAELLNGDFVGLQAKWFIDGLNDNQISQIAKSIRSALCVRPQMKTYIVCIPKDLTSKKKGKGGKITENTEENRWSNLKAEIAKDYPMLALELWNDHMLTNQLQKHVLEGAKRFWFDAETITFESLVYQFNKARDSWLKERYVPDIHASGYIFKSSAYLLRTIEVKQKTIERMSGARDLAQRLKNELETFQKILKRDLESPAKDMFEFVTGVIEYVNRNLETVRNSSDIENFKLEDKTNYSVLDDQLRILDNDSQFSILSGDIKKLIDEHNALNPESYLADLCKIWNGRFRTFAGGPGTGKTHALANIVDVALNKGRPALIIQAKAIADPSSWKSVLQSALGLGTDWSEFQILNALESRATITEIENRYSEDDNEFSSFLICVDGLDETQNWDAWKDRIQELRVLTDSHPRLRFIISSREYMLEETRLSESLNDCIVHLPTEGDVPIYKVFDGYMKKYKIDISETPWVRWSLRTLLALRFFCNQYRGRRFEKSEQLSTTIGSLLKDHITRIEKEFTEQIKPISIGPDKLLIGLVNVAKFFLENQEIQHDALVSMIKQPIQLDDGHVNSLINRLINHGLLISFKKGFGDPLKPGETWYQPSYQPVIEFLIATEVVRAVIEKNELPDHLKRQDGILGIASTMLFIDHNILPDEDGLWGHTFGEEKIKELKCLALASAHPERSVPFKDWVRIELTASMPRSRFLLMNLCFPVARVPCHPLGPLLVHEILAAYKNASDRDLIWSGLDYVPNNHGAIWEGQGYNPIREDTYSLDTFDKFNGLPLLHAWNLTSIDNEIVSRCSQNLVKWGDQNSSEFYKLFCMMLPSNDPQLEEVLICCAYGIVTLLKPDQNEFIKDLSQWLIKNVFNPDAIKQYRSSVIRGAGRAILERASQLDLISEDDAKASRPPFDLIFEPLPLFPDAAKENESYGPIWHDLAWYTIKKAYNGFFECKTEKYPPRDDSDNPHEAFWQESEIQYVLSEDIGLLDDEEKERLKNALTRKQEEIKRRETDQNKFLDVSVERLLKLLAEAREAREGKEEGEKEQNTLAGVRKKDFEYYPDAACLLKKHCTILGFECGHHQLVLAAVYQFLLNLGWNKDNFYGKPNGGKEGEILGADLAVTRQYFMASHGSRSKQMSFAEKYIWAAVHYLQGYFSDYIEFNDTGDERKRVDDYSLIVNIPNPAQSVLPKYSSNNSQRWIGSQSLSPVEPSIQGDLKSAISRWMQEAALPDFSQLLLPEQKFTKHIADDELCLMYSFISQTEITGLGESLLWLHGFLIEMKDMEILESNLKERNLFLRKLISETPDGMTTGVECDCYISPRDAVFLSWKKELEPTTSVTVVANGRVSSIALHRCVSRVTSTSTEHEERTYHLPSRIVRNGLGITSGDGYVYMDDKEKVLAVNVDSGQAYRNSQDCLYLDRTSFFSFVENTKKVPIWLLRFDRRASVKAFHSIGGIDTEITHCFLCYWKDGGLASFKFESTVRS